MNKKILPCLIPMLLLTASALPANAASADDQKFFEDNLKQFVTLEVQPLHDAAVKQVLAARVYHVKVHFNGSADVTDAVLARAHDKVVALTQPETTADMPNLPTLINPEFKLKTDADAKTMETVFNALYPLFHKDDAKAESIRHKGNEWTFVRGKFFDHFEGFIVTTDDSGKITKVARSLEIK